MRSESELVHRTHSEFGCRAKIGRPPVNEVQTDTLDQRFACDLCEALGIWISKQLWKAALPVCPLAPLLLLLLMMSTECKGLFLCPFSAALEKSRPSYVVHTRRKAIRPSPARGVRRHVPLKLLDGRSRD